jgi:hypothetical protein
VVRAIKGEAQYSEGATWLPLKTGQTLGAGNAVRTANGANVDLFLDENGPLVRLMENTTLGIDKLNFEKTGVDTVIETQLDLKSGRIFGVVKKLSASSKYEVKTPNGVAGIRGTQYQISATGEVQVLQGSVVVVNVRADGSVVTQVVNAGEMFVPSTGKVEKMPPDTMTKLMAEADSLMGGKQVMQNLPIQPEVYVSPTVGSRRTTR